MMTHAEAKRQLDAWLLVPVDYEKILPALYTMRGDSEYAGYVARVAEAEFRKPEDIEADLEQYALRLPNINARTAALDQKLEAISGVKNRSVADAFADDDEDILTGLENRINRKYDVLAQKQDELNNAFQKYARSYRSNTTPNALVPTCSHCDHALVDRTVEKYPSVALIVVMMLVFWPIGLVLLLTSKRTYSQQYCPRCGIVHNEHVIR